ncbi:hypothetical protein DVT68_18835 [Dyella solisilvae]|uniref:Gylcosyl hydrolase 115 C-terminal domain-containing protein n=1 Tax=Dyella solisilvae TaxID=1920168 RepID=A0A370K3C2_9GAMM|nr:glycosyl hydrolase 115 family protein [Dyella solisilvae]RDI97132.1 hypothetical protein DVT68_18835 [Dyella solisilvae]
MFCGKRGRYGGPTGRSKSSLAGRSLAFGPIALSLALGLCGHAYACDAPVGVCSRDGAGEFGLVRQGRPAAIVVDPSADSAVVHVADSFAADLQRVSGQLPARFTELNAASGEVVIVGTLGHSAAIDALVRDGKIQADDLAGQWEAYRQIVVDHPYPNIARALVIVGSDRRGAVYGTYDISEKMGVSPWYWFADVPVQHRSNVFLTAGSRRDQPKVKYRGFFINDEAPSFSTWATEHFGGFNARMYEHVFELELRLKGNYLWPAMWAPRAFADDDPENMKLADAMGIVMGTSHHEAMMRAQDEWHRHTDGGVTGGPWDYSVNAANLRTFWRGGIERMMSKGHGQGYESIVTVGMRGDGDEAMVGDKGEAQLQRIVADQRSIIADVTGKPADQTPQVWALYKEVQDYYDQGMKAPDDVTLLFSDDNWGQLRRVPAPGSARKGGYGIYYHFDYVGGPRNYKWINTNQIEKVWQQMDLAYASGVRTMWIVNVGDIKPMEFPLSFFMKQAWDPEAMTLDAMEQYPEAWARSTFGADQAAAIAQLITRYSQLAARRKPELVDADSFHLGEAGKGGLDGGEFGSIMAEWRDLERAMQKQKALLPEDQKDAYFQLVEHPIAALSNLYRLYYDVAWNRKLAAQNDPRANAFADDAEEAFRRDKALTDAYHALHGGKWNGMMAQTHIGYTGWQEPTVDAMPAVTRVPSAGAKRADSAGFDRGIGPVRNVDGVIAIEAPHYSRAVDGRGLTWRAIPHLGRTAGAVTAFPQGQAATDEKDGVRLEYDVDLGKPGDLTIQLTTAPTLDVSGHGALRTGISVDDGAMQIVTDRMTPAANGVDTQAQKDWTEAVKDNARVLQTTFPGVAAGRHVIKIWRLDGNVVLEKLVLGTSNIPPSYLGPPETR